MRSRPGAEAAGPIRVTLVLDVAAVGGAEIVLRNTFAHLDPARVVTDVVCLREAGPLADDFRAVSDGVVTLPRGGKLDRAGIGRVPRLARHFRRRGTDVVVVSHHHRAALTLARLAAVLAGARSVVAAHDMDLTRVGNRVLPRHVVETLFLSAGLALLAPSQGRYLHDEEGMGRSWRSRAREFLVPNGIPAPEPEPPGRRAEVRAELGVEDDDVVVLMVARLSRQKAHEVMLDAVARAAHPKLRLVVVGDGARRGELEALVAAQGLEKNVTFLGLRRDVPRLLAGGDVFALSSVHEGVPISVIEAMTQGLPVVATDVGALRDQVTDGVDGFLVESGDAAALAERLTRLADDPALRADLGRRARDRASAEFTIENTAAAFTDMVEAVARR
ncbi:glycosyltransferase involved in cell wall biosynthesis [Actinomycetospora succinea]|uniref:Glycosyltransferase involved in cell wall biosynthesis n=1 Tax=Actinomycetospora succinea TaxID=663603 RepID=A0A4R6UP64_9PSEU|nr:glycosyltransferase [Actinomycetospora succinea]TDQ48980.1 glycosyltransferase involved in cell wall biosynthesis [Actinomycetospora succinea]